jgi:hypothetical protein
MSIRRFIGHWWKAARHGVGGYVFGWGTPVAAVVIGFVQHQYGLSIWVSEQASWWLTPLLSALAALLVVAAFNAMLLAPYRAWRMLRPFRIDVVSGQLDGEYPKQTFPRQSAAVVMKNLSYRQRSNCVLHVFHVAGFDNQHHALPRFVSEFTLPPGDKQQIKFLSWTTRSPPRGNDPTFMLYGPLAPVWGGNVFTLPCGSYDIDIRIGVPEADLIVVPCRVWADGNVLQVALREAVRFSTRLDKRPVRPRRAVSS